jgi:hypothetical protein
MTAHNSSQLIAVHNISPCFFVIHVNNTFPHRSRCFQPLSLSLSLSLWLYSPLDLGLFFSFFILYTVGRTPWTGDQPVTRPLHTHRTTQTQIKRIQTSMPRMRFEFMRPVTERSKKVHALDRAVTAIRCFKPTSLILLLLKGTVYRNVTICNLIETYRVLEWTMSIFTGRYK